SRAAARRAIERELEDLKGLLLDFTTQPVQERGYSLERLLNQLFQVFDITSRPSFRTVGEQIDGAFTLNQHDFLVEAKWTTDKVGLADLDAFSGKVGRKLDNTLGLLISMNGFQDTAVSSYSQKRSTIILMDGADLYAVLDGRIELQELIQRKRRHAAQTGNVLFPVSNMLAA
ncbi:MAG: restriction endonuclease, partial [Chloroflexia bacterium]|nr:restriction endonuclease [Chloroflexia bacterium]